MRAPLRVLFADPNSSNLDELKRDWRAECRSWQMHFVSSADEALAFLDAHLVHVIVTGVEGEEDGTASFLAKVKDTHPDTVRIVLADPAHQAMIAKSLGIAHQHLERPCPLPLLRSTVDQILQMRSLIECEELRTWIAGIDHLPTLPDLYLQISEELRSFDPSLQHVIEQFQRDPALCTKVLRLVNSSYFGLAQPVMEVDEAIRLLGVEILQSVVLFSGVYSDLETQGPLPVSYDEFAAHAISVGRVAQELSHILPVGTRARKEAFTAGILHDIGKLILALHRSDDYRKVLAKAAEGKYRLSDIERAVFGVNHGEVGAYLLTLWGFPCSLVESTAFHHMPTQSLHDQPSTLAVVYLADRSCQWDGTEQDRLTPDDFDLAYLRRVGLESKLDECIALREELGLLNA